MLKLICSIVLLWFVLSANSQITMLVKKNGFVFMEGKDSIFFYQRSPKDLNGSYSRCNYIHPLYDFDGLAVTEDFPADHLHHRGIFWAWHQIVINGQQIADGWELKNFTQKVVDFEFKALKGTGVINTTVEWKSPLWKNGEQAYLKENTSITIHPKIGNYRQIDFEIKLNALTDRLQMGGSNDEKGYSGFSARLKLPADIQFSDANGLVEPTNTAINAGDFMNISGTFQKPGKKEGVVIYSRSSNPQPSNSWILRKSASMQNVAYPGCQLVSIPYGKPLILNYSIVVYQGELSAKQIKKIMK